MTPITLLKSLRLVIELLAQFKSTYNATAKPTLWRNPQADSDVFISTRGSHALRSTAIVPGDATFIPQSATQQRP